MVGSRQVGTRGSGRRRLSSRRPGPLVLVIAIWAVVSASGVLSAPSAGAAGPLVVTPSTGLQDLQLVHLSATIDPNLTVGLFQNGGTTGVGVGSATADATGHLEADVYVHLLLPGHAGGGGPADCRTDSCSLMVRLDPVDTSLLAPITFAPGAQPLQAFTVTPHDGLGDGQVVRVALRAGASIGSSSAAVRTCDPAQRCSKPTPVAQDPVTGAIDASYTVASTFASVTDGSIVDCRAVVCQVQLVPPPFFDGVAVTFAAIPATTTTTTTISTAPVATPRFTG